MKKLLVFLFTMLVTQIPALSLEKIVVDILPQESYLILLTAPAKTALVTDTEVLNAEILTTLYNEKNQILLKSLKSGIARLYVSMNKNVVVLEFNVNEINEDKDFGAISQTVNAIFKIDTIEPQKTLSIELDEPPVLREVAQ